MRRAALIALVTALSCVSAQAQLLAPFDGRRPPPPRAGLTNTTPLVFGMSPADASIALRAPLAYVRGKPGDEIFFVERQIGGSGFFPREDQLFLQFRKGRLTGWKADWGRDWLWQ